MCQRIWNRPHFSWWVTFTQTRITRLFWPSSGQKPAPVHCYFVVKRIYYPAFAQATAWYRTAAMPPGEGTKPSLILTIECVGDTRRSWLMSPSDCRAGDHLPVPSKARVDGDGELGLPGGSALVEATPVRPPERGPQLLQQPALEGHREARQRSALFRHLGGDRNSLPSPLFSPGGPAWAAGLLRLETLHCLPRVTPRSPRCSRITRAPRNHPLPPPH